MKNWQNIIYKHLISVLQYLSLSCLISFPVFAQPFFEKHLIDPTLFIPELFPSQSETIASWQPDIFTELPNAQNTKHIKIKSNGIIFKFQSALYILTTSHSVSGLNTKVIIDNYDLSLKENEFEFVTNNIIEDFAILKIRVPIKIKYYFTVERINDQDEIIFLNSGNLPFLYYQMSLNKFTPLKEFNKNHLIEARSKISLEDENTKVLKDGYYSKIINRYIFNMPITPGQSGSPVLEYIPLGQTSSPTYKMIGMITSFHRLHYLSYVIPIKTVIQELKRPEPKPEAIHKSLKWIYDNGPTRISDHYSESHILGLAGGGATGEGGGGATGEGGLHENSPIVETSKLDLNSNYKKVYESTCWNKIVSFFKNTHSHIELLTFNSLSEICKNEFSSSQTLHNKLAISPMDLLKKSDRIDNTLFDSGVCQIRATETGIKIMAEYDHNLIHPQKRYKFRWPDIKNYNSKFSIDINISSDEISDFSRLNLVYTANNQDAYLDISEIFFDNPYLPTYKSKLASLYISSNSGFRQIFCEVKSD